MRSFTHDAPAQRIVFGAGTIATVSTELNRLNVTRAVVLSTPGQRHLAGRVADLLGERAVGQFHGAVPHTPVEVTEEALEFLRNRRGDAVVSVGGGSTTGLGKAVASTSGHPAPGHSDDVRRFGTHAGALGRPRAARRPRGPAPR